MGARYNSNSDPFGGIILFLIIMGVVIISGIYESKKDRERRDAIKDYCERKGLEYSEEAYHIPSIVQSFSIMNTERGHSHEYLAESSGLRGDYYFSIFDHNYTIGYGKGSTHYNDTVCIISRAGLDVPQFFLRDENKIMDTLGKIFGGQDINFKEDPTFSNAFVLQGFSETDIREFFDEDIRDAFVRNHIEGYKYEGKKEYFVIAKSSKSDMAERLQMLSVGISIFKVFAPEDNFGEALGNVI